MPEADVVSWFRMVGDYGLPLFIVLLLIFGIYKGTRALWAFCQPLIVDLVGKVGRMVDKQTEFVQYVQDNIQKQSQTITSLATRDDIRAVHTDVKEILKHHLP